MFTLTCTLSGVMWDLCRGTWDLPSCTARCCICMLAVSRVWAGEVTKATRAQQGWTLSYKLFKPILFFSLCRRMEILRALEEYPAVKATDHTPRTFSEFWWEEEVPCIPWLHLERRNLFSSWVAVLNWLINPLCFTTVGATSIGDFACQSGEWPVLTSRRRSEFWWQQRIPSLLPGTGVPCG